MRRFLALALIGAFSAIALILSLPPFELWALAILSQMMFFYGIFYARKVTESLMVGFVYGLLLFFFHGFEWVQKSMSINGLTPGASLVFSSILVLYLTFFPVVTAYLSWRTTLYKRSPWQLGFILATVWVGCEWLRTVLFNGFPWLLHGYAFTDTWFAATATVIGVFGLTWIVSFFSATVSASLVVKKFAYYPLFIISVVVILGSFFMKDIHWSESIQNQTRVKVALIQGNILQREKWQSQYRMPTLKRYLRHTKKALMKWEEQAKIDRQESHHLIVWPETAFPSYDRELKELWGKEKIDSSVDYSLITGALNYKNGEYFNNMFDLHSDWHYSKRRLVAFGEYFPFIQSFDWLSKLLDFPFDSFTEGAPKQPPFVIAGHAIGINICYEIAFAEELSKLGDVSAIINASNEGWFDGTYEKELLWQMARMRAIEFSRPILRVANTGISGHIDERGLVVRRLKENEQGTVLTTVDLQQGNTPYSLIREWWLLLFVIVVVLISSRQRNS